MKFDEKLFNEIMKSKAKEKLLIVPAQLTLSAEEAAFDVLGKEYGVSGFFDFHIMSGNKLRSEILSKVGGPGETMIDALGRSMILRKCAKELSEQSELLAYSSVAASDDFLNGAGDFIVQFKQSQTQNLEGLAGPDSMLGKKLSDMAKISAAYESYMNGKYIDSEDGLLYVTQKVSECDWIKNSEIWFAGFYSFTKREQEFLKALDKQSFGCHVLLSNPKEELPASFTALIKAESTNKEAEIIASEILRLIREEKIDAEDIVILSANLAEEAPVFKRVFDSIGIRNFVDEKRSLMHQEAASKIALLLDMAADGLRTNTVIQFVADEDFTNYCKSYHVKNNAFLNNFKYGGSDKIAAEIKRDEFARLIEPFLESFGKAKTVREKTEALYEFLIGPFDMPGKLKIAKKEAEDLGYKDYSEELGQIWGVIIHIFDQAVELLGGEKIDNKEYRDLIKNAFKDIKIGLLPQESNCIMIGDLYRSKITNAKAVFVSGFSEGCAPRTGNASKILTNEEIDKLSSAGISLCKDLKQITKEDKIMIFEAFEKASEKLYIAYAFADNDGKEKGQSYLLARLIKGEVKTLDENSINIYSIENLAQVLLKCKRSGEAIPANWQVAAAVLREKSKQRYDALIKGLLYKNEEIKLSKKETREILNTKSCSPSSIEKYINCPFAYFVQFGLKAEEPVDFSMSSLDSGNIYHQILDRLSKYLSADGSFVRNENSLWQKITDSEIESFVSKTAEEIISEDSSGLYTKSFEEEYRSGRIAKTATHLAKHMVAQVRQGNIDQINTEQQFKFNFAGIEIHGKIDRLDSTHLEDGDYIKIVDYKTSSAVSFNKEKIEKGKDVQLMLYLEAAMDSGKKKETKPVGIFYFTIEKEQTESLLEELGEISDALAEKIAKEYKLDGAYVAEEKAFATLDKDAKALNTNKSKVLTMSAGRALSEDEFEKLRQTFKENFEGSVAKLQMGDVSVKPARYKDSSACKFCKYNSICKFDLQIEGCKYD